MTVSGSLRRAVVAAALGAVACTRSSALRPLGTVVTELPDYPGEAVTVLTTPPELVRFARLTYPNELLHCGLNGEVGFEFTLDTLGRAEPGSITILHATHRLFIRSVETFILGSTFRPARRNAGAVRVRLRSTMRFAVAGGSDAPWPGAGRRCYDP